MTLTKKVKAISEVYSRLDSDLTAYRQKTGLGCKPGCGACCTKPDIEATVLEFLPLGLHLHKTGQLDALLQTLEERKEDPVCILFSPLSTDPGAGSCSQYLHRGLICRLFGFSASRDKYGNPLLVTCRIIKNMMPELYNEAVEAIKNGDKVPMMREYHEQLAQIDFSLAGRRYPINEAIRMALETVAWYFDLRSRRVS